MHTWQRCASGNRSYHPDDLPFSISCGIFVHLISDTDIVTRVGNSVLWLAKPNHFFISNRRVQARIQAILHICDHYAHMIELCIGKQIMPPGRFVFLHFSPSQVADLSTSLSRLASLCLRREECLIVGTFNHSPISNRRIQACIQAILHLRDHYVHIIELCIRKHIIPPGWLVFLHFSPFMWRICPPHF